MASSPGNTSRASGGAQEAAEAKFKVQFETLSAVVKELASAEGMINAQNAYLKAMKLPDPTPKWERAFKTLNDAIHRVFVWDFVREIQDRYSKLMAPPPPPPKPEPKSDPEPPQYDPWSSGPSR